MKCNTKLNNKKSDDFLTKVDNMKVRIIKYEINKNKYILITNLFSMSYEAIKDLYFDRWSVEEYFKYVKQNFNFSNFNEKKLDSIKKTIYAQLIVTKIVNIITYLCKKYKTKNSSLKKYSLKKSIYKINQRCLVDGLYSGLLGLTDALPIYNDVNLKNLHPYKL